MQGWQDTSNKVSKYKDTTILFKDSRYKTQVYEIHIRYKILYKIFYLFINISWIHISQIIYHTKTYKIIMLYDACGMYLSFMFYSS